MDRERFQTVILAYYRRHGRSFPWRETTDPYAILVSEIMLQQTQTSRVVPKYEAFLPAFPCVSDLAHASLASVLRLWQGLGYNRRAKFLHTCAQSVLQEYDGRFPSDRELLRELPGIGEYTSGAICAFAFGQAVAFMDTNIRRVYLHHFFPERQGVRDREVLAVVEDTLHREDPRTWYHALMDYGAMLAATLPNANRRSAHYTRQSAFGNSNRQIRGRILHSLAEGGKSLPRLRGELPFDPQRIETSVAGLLRDGLVVREEENLYLPGDN